MSPKMWQLAQALVPFAEVSRACLEEPASGDNIGGLRGEHSCLSHNVATAGIDQGQGVAEPL